MHEYSLFSRLIASVGLEFLEPIDLEVLEKLSKATPLKDDGLLECIVSPRVSGIGGKSYLLEQTGADYDPKVQEQILKRWACLRVSDVFLGILKAAQSGSIPRLIFEPGGMYPEPTKPRSIGKIGKKKLKSKSVRKLLKSLKLMHEDLWKIEQLANVVEHYAKKTRG